MTNDDKALVYELRKFQPDTTMCNEAADRIEALSAENERLREALGEVSILWRRHKYSGDFDLWLRAHIRAALREQQ